MTCGKEGPSGIKSKVFLVHAQIHHILVIFVLSSTAIAPVFNSFDIRHCFPKKITQQLLETAHKTCVVVEVIRNETKAGVHHLTSLISVVKDSWMKIRVLPSGGDDFLCFLVDKEEKKKMAQKISARFE